MHITSVTQSPLAAAAARLTPANQSQVASTPQRLASAQGVQSRTASTTGRLTPSNVSAGALKAADGDGDGKTGTAALNDGDAAARAARRQAVDIKA